MNAEQHYEIADAVASATLAVAGVVGLHGGEFGEVATYLPGRKVVGIRVDADLCDIHITAEYPTDVNGVARGVLAAVQPLVTVPVSVTVEDVVAGALS
ncbi:hypothetical protein [Rhodococcoides kyotonense]|uniref:Asp23/Gls24 family envelope stress response protein n=1 Tax=Rhodococcoides kyotonense TaxID=398843 RepID=A0A239NBZ0_9NOCA|nr:hypothetical protein [Rhodococcus kyotonensis]SNT51689.1 hypothetical protein SAMN05421642_13323 [Rhodococcus kyotonensis]